VSPKFLCGWRRSGACLSSQGRRAASTRKADEGGIPGRMPTEENAARARASGIARRRTEEERAEGFFPLRATTTAADSTRDARAPKSRCVPGRRDP
jgi:hypothetical protein